MKLKTSEMTKAELDTARSILSVATNPLQVATLMRRLHTRQRIGTAIEQGVHIVCLTLYTIGRNGRPVGSADVIELYRTPSVTDATRFIERWVP